MNLMDALVRAQAEECNLTPPEREYRFDPTRRWRFDYAWLKYSPLEPYIALEVQGGVWSGGKHGRGSGIVKDYEKLNAAQCQGWIVLQMTPQQVRAGELTQWLRLAVRGAGQTEAIAGAA